MSKTALCYHRKSRVFKGRAAPASPEIQQANTNAKAAELQLTPENYTDAEGHRSGRDEERVEWQRLKARLRDSDVTALIVNTWDRPVRNTKLLLALVDECERLGVRFVSCHDNIDTRSASGRFQLTIIAGVGEYEANVASERQASAADYLRRERGRHVGWPPFGAQRVKTERDYTLNPSTRAQPNGTDHAALQRIYELRRESGKSIYTLTLIINSEGWRFRTRKGELRPWLVDDVLRVLRNHWLYAGYVTVGRSHRGDFEVIPGSHAPLLPPTLTEPIALSFVGRPRGWKHVESNVFPLTGILYCGVCGERMRGFTRYGRLHYEHIHHIGCSLPYRFIAGEIESQVRSHIAALRLPAALTAQSDKAVMRMLAAEHSNRRAENPLHVEGALERLKELYIEGHIERTEYDRRRLSYEQQMVKSDNGTLDAVSLAAVSVLRSIETASGQRLREMIKTLYERIELCDTKLSLKYTPREWCRDWA